MQNIFNAFLERSQITKLIVKGCVALMCTCSISAYAQSTIIGVDYPSVDNFLLSSEGGELTQQVTPELSDTIYISTIDALRNVAQQSDQVVIMQAGEYVFTNTMPDDPKTIILFSGSNNEFILKDVRLMLPTSVLRAMGPGNTHEFDAYRINGANNTFRGGHFENTGTERPYKSLAEFEVFGSNNSFINCTIIIRGSSPYGYGDMYGKGSDHFVGLYKHSAMSILGDNVLVDSCDFEVYSFGHGIHIHGAQNTVLRNINMLGAVRLTDEIYEETSGPAFDYGFKIYYPSWDQGEPIPTGKMLHLTEDGIRAYTDGDDMDGVSRRTGHITVENCFVDKMRGGITLTLGSGGADVRNCTAINCEHEYSLPSNAIVRNCKGNAAYGPLIFQPYTNRKNTDIELELIDTDTVIGDHPLARIVGSGHKITFTYNGTDTLMNSHPIMIGEVGTRYDETNSTTAELYDKNRASDINFINETSAPVILTKYASGSTVTSTSEVTDLGTSNTVK